MGAAWLCANRERMACSELGKIALMPRLPRLNVMQQAAGNRDCVPAEWALKAHRLRALGNGLPRSSARDLVRVAATPNENYLLLTVVDDAWHVSGNWRERAFMHLCQRR